MSGQGRFGEAIKKFTVALASEPRDVRYLAARCWALAGQGKNFKSALTDCDLAVKLAPRFAAAYDSRGLVYLKEGKNAAAIRNYSKSLRLNEDQPTALFGRGIAEWHQGPIASARYDLTIARQGDPDIDETYMLVGVLEGDCRVGGEACSLPETLRPQSKRPYVFVSARGRQLH